MHDQRLTDRLVNFWGTLRKDAPMPDFAHFNKSAIEDIWQQCILFAIMPAPEGASPRVNFQSVGERLRSFYGQDMTGHTFTPSAGKSHSAQMIRKVPEMLANPAPITDEGQFVNERSKMVKYRSCLLPFGRNGKVSHILAGISWREF